MSSSRRRTAFFSWGADRRGTIYSIYDFTEAQGVSPWYYFADVPVKTKEKIAYGDGYLKSDYPSVEYRGIFLNDEEELNAWAKLHTQDDTIGPETYGRIFELILRLKGNYIWPAMHVNYFNENPENGRLADSMGIVVGTSHCDMLLRSNQNEWKPWIEKKGYTDVSYDYSIEGRNREILKEYWRESVEQNKDFEVCYTIGMRGIHDTGFVTSAIDGDSGLTEEEKTEARVKLLEKVMLDQREILKEVLGEEKGKRAMQTFIPYKEVLSLYDRGLKVPDDVTVIWANDNHGNIRRYPDKNERKRSGGHGLYYHNSYWAPPPMSYLFINSIPLAHTGNELRKAWESGIRKLWVLNVGALKPLEQDVEFFLRCGWDAGKKDSITKDTDAFVEDWINRNFSGMHGKMAAALYNIYAQTTNMRKVEHMDNHVFSQTAWNNEAGRRVLRLKEMFDGGNAIYAALPDQEKDAFFQMFLMKMHASYFTALEYYYADRSQLSYNRGNMAGADEYIRFSRKAAGYRRWMIHYYNKVMAGGKWDRILTPERFSPPPTALYPAGTPALYLGKPEMTLYMGETDLTREGTITFDFWGSHVKALELGNKGAGKISYRAAVTEGSEWLKLSGETGACNSGAYNIEEILYLEAKKSWDGENKEGILEIWDDTGGKVYRITVRGRKKGGPDAGFRGFIEGDGCISIAAGDFTAEFPAGDCCWEKIPHMGRGQGDAMMAHNPHLEPLEERRPDIAGSPRLEYSVFTVTDGPCCLEIHRALTLNSTGRIRLAAGIDDLPPVILESEIRDEWLGDWKNCVMNNGEKMRAFLPFVEKGSHVVKIFMIDNYVTFSSLVLYTGEITESDAGPEESCRIISGQREWSGKQKRRLPFYPVPDETGMDRFLLEMYGYREENVPLLPVVYAGRDFWKKDILYMENEQYEQKILGNRKYTAEKKKNPRGVFAYFGRGYFQERDGRLAIEAEYAMENSYFAWLTPDPDHGNISWTHLQAETNGGTGFAMYVKKRGMFWEEPFLAPGMHYRIRIENPGCYHIWLLLRFFDEESDSCFFALDGEVQPLQEQLSGGSLFTYSTTQVYFWSLVTDMYFEKGVHQFSVIARKSGLRIDRIYCTAGEERPPADAEWTESERNE